MYNIGFTHLNLNEYHFTILPGVFWLKKVDGPKNEMLYMKLNENV